MNSSGVAPFTCNLLRASPKLPNQIFCLFITWSGRLLFHGMGRMARHLHGLGLQPSPWYGAFSFARKGVPWQWYHDRNEFPWSHCPTPSWPYLVFQLNPFGSFDPYLFTPGSAKKKNESLSLGSKKNGDAHLPKASPLKVTSNDYFYSNPPLEVKKNKHLGLWEVNLPTSFRYLPRSFLQKLDFFLLLCCPSS